MRQLASFKYGWKSMIIPCLIGISAMLIQHYSNMPILDPLILALAIGIFLRTFIAFSENELSAFRLAPTLFIPIGVIFYGAVNLNFVEFAKVDINFIFLAFIVFLVYIITTLFLASVLKLNERIGYLIATGSAICGASAIAITSQAVDAESDDVSLSLISVFFSALIGLFFILPFLNKYFAMTGMEHGVFSGAVLQFTGFVKAAVANASEEVKVAALSVKAIRYVGLIFVIPMFASFVKGKFHVPWFLWAFLGAGILFSFAPPVAQALKPTLKIILTVLWSIAMAAIGLNANLVTLFTKNGLKAFIVSFISFLIAIVIFLGGIKLV